eukprot:675480-Hanusia_phi.AAC.1
MAADHLSTENLNTRNMHKFRKCPKHKGQERRQANKEEVRSMDPTEPRDEAWHCCSNFQLDMNSAELFRAEKKKFNNKGPESPSEPESVTFSTPGLSFRLAVLARKELQLRQARSQAALQRPLIPTTEALLCSY